MNEQHSAGTSNEHVDHKRWLAETWQMIEQCAASLNPMARVSLSPAGCKALIETRSAEYCRGRDDQMKAAADQLGNKAHENETNDAADAAKWRTFMNLARIRIVGGAGFQRDDPNHYAFVTVELWTKHDEPTSPQAFDLFGKFMAIAERAQGGAALKAAAPRDPLLDGLCDHGLRIEDCERGCKKAYDMLPSEADNPTHQHAAGCPKLWGYECECTPEPLSTPSNGNPQA